MRASMTRDGFRHHPFYCEENVFHLCSHEALGERPRSAVFVSGALGGFVMWHQRAARRPGAPLFWDYHVILLVEDPWEIWDLDSTLGLPVPAAHYLERSFRADVPPEIAPRFRVVPAAELLRTLASDRSHMRRPDGTFDRPPPPWPPISAPERGSNLRRFIDTGDAFLGERTSLEGLIERTRGAEAGRGGRAAAPRDRAGGRG